MPDQINGNEVRMYLADYLRPRGIYLYESLAPQMDAYHKAGKKVSLISVPGFLMATNYLGATDGKIWSDLRGNYYETAEDFLKGKNQK